MLDGPTRGTPNKPVTSLG